MNKIGSILSTLAMLPLAGTALLVILLISIPLRAVRRLSRLFSRQDPWAYFDVDDDSSGPAERSEDLASTDGTWA